MESLGKSLYNSLRINWLEDPSSEIAPWQTEDYRALKTKEIFKRLESFDISLSENSFLLYAQNCNSPEELIETLWLGDEEPQKIDQAYLLLFELWRRLVPEKQSLSIFCDELDHLFYLHDHELLESEEKLQDALDELETILDETVDQGISPEEAFQNFSNYLAHDFESFIYDYIAKQLDQSDEIYASELLDGFYEYIIDKRWFDLLRMRLYERTDFEEGHLMLERILEQTKEEPDLDFLLEIMRFLVHQGNIEDFNKAALLTRSLLQKEEDFQELLALTCEFYRMLDREKDEEKFAEILRKRISHAPDAPLSPSDKDINAYFRELKAVH
jgi:hypothetical protein